MRNERKAARKGPEVLEENQIGLRITTARAVSQAGNGRCTLLQSMFGAGRVGRSNALRAQVQERAEPITVTHGNLSLFLFRLSLHSTRNSQREPQDGLLQGRSFHFCGDEFEGEEK